MDKLKIVVCGATGPLGQSVTAHLRKNALWQVIALIRHPGSAATAALKAVGLEVVIQVQEVHNYDSKHFYHRCVCHEK